MSPTRHPSSPASSSAAGDHRNISTLLARLIVSGDSCHRPSSLLPILTPLSTSPFHLSALHLLRPLALHMLPSLSPSSTTLFLFNLILRSFSRSRLSRDSLYLFSSMLRLPLSPDRFTFPSLFVATSFLSSPIPGLQTHSQALRRGFLSDSYVINTILGMYSTFEDMDSARNIFRSSSAVVDVVSWNTMINGHVKSGELEIARKMFDEMPMRNEVTWSAIISGYVGKGELDVALELFDVMPVGRNVVTWNCLISGFARNGLLMVAKRLFDEMPEKNLVSWNSMVSGYVGCGEMDLARELFENMPEKDVVSWSCMIAGYVWSSLYLKALNLFNEMQKERKVKPNEITMVSVLSACANLAALDQGKWIHAYIDKNKMILDNDYNLGAALIDMYSKCGCMNAALKVFNSLQQKNVSSWNALITGLAINGAAYESLSVFEDMLISGIKPNDITFVGVLSACTHGGLVDRGRQYFENMSNAYGVHPDIKHYGCMVDLLGRAGLLEEAEKMVRSMPMKPDEMVLGSLLAACRIHKDVRIADSVSNNFLKLKSQQAGCHVLISNIYSSVGRWTDASNMRVTLKKRGIKKEPGSSSALLDRTVCKFSSDRLHLEAGKIYLGWER